MTTHVPAPLPEARPGTPLARVNASIDQIMRGAAPDLGGAPFTRLALAVIRLVDPTEDSVPVDLGAADVAATAAGWIADLDDHSPTRRDVMARHARSAGKTLSLARFRDSGTERQRASQQLWSHFHRVGSQLLGGRRVGISYPLGGILVEALALHALITTEQAARS